MPECSNRTTHFATLFESITGQTTVTEYHRSDISVRLDENGAESPVADYIDTADGLEDVIDESETR